jgi:hypothetical protein
MRSKLIPSLFFSIALLCGSAAAQSPAFIIGGGLNFSTFNRDAPSGLDLGDQSMRTGFNLLAGFQAPTGSGATVLGLGYETRGAVWTDEGPTGEDVDLTIKFNYVHLAFAYKLMSSQGYGPVFYFAPGVDLAFLTSSEMEVDNDSRELDDVNSVDLDLGASVGFQVPMANNAFFMEAGYAYGLFDTDTESDEFSAHNSAIKLRAGFLVGL